MPDLPQKKVGIIACSGEELPEGTVTRLAALKVLEKLHPGDTVTICLPLFLAGGEGDRAFARFYPTIAVDGCEKRCAYRGTKMYSNTPAASIVVTDIVADHHLPQPENRRRLNPAELQVVDAVASQIANQVDHLIGKDWSRRKGAFDGKSPDEEKTATCSCGSGIPIQKIQVNGQEVTLVALPVLFQKYWESGKAPSNAALDELMEEVKIYNAIETENETAVRRGVFEAYTTFWNKKGAENA